MWSTFFFNDFFLYTYARVRGTHTVPWSQAQEFWCLTEDKEKNTNTLNVQNNLCFKYFNTTYHYSPQVLALPVLSLCPTLQLSSPPLIFRPLKRAALHLLVPRHLKSTRAVERTPTSSLCLWFHLSTSQEANSEVLGGGLCQIENTKSLSKSHRLCHLCH